MKIVFTFLLLSINTILFAQLKPDHFGFRYEFIEFQGDTIHILISSKKGEENLRKPIIFEVQGSTAIPLIVHDGKNITSSISLLQGFVEDDFHLILINKPGLPLICHQDSLTKGKYKDRITNRYPEKYLKNNNLNYYVERNNTVLNFLKKQDWIDSTKVIVQGHSEGSSIAAHMVDKLKGITHLIYSGGEPYFPRILAMIQQDRKVEQDSVNPWIARTFDYWKDVVNYPLSLTRNEGWNTNYGTYSFSQSENEVLKRVKIPILISYGTKDEAAPYNDMFHIETIRDKCQNFTFRAHVGLNHYYQNSERIDNLSKVVSEWLNWISEN